MIDGNTSLIYTDVKDDRTQQEKKHGVTKC